VLDYKQILRLYYGKQLSGRQIAELQGCGKSAVNSFLKKFRECSDFSYPLSEDLTNELINQTLYKPRGGVRRGSTSTQFREFDCPVIHKALAKKGETLKHLWRKYNAAGPVTAEDGSVRQPYSYRQYCKIFGDWCEARNVTSRIPRYPGQNCELDFAGMNLYLRDKITGEEATKVTIFVATMSYSNYCYAEGLTTCDIQHWIAANNNALKYFGGVTPIVTNDNCKVAVIQNKDWRDPVLNKDFQEWAVHNNTVLLPARVQGPRWKPHVENAVKVISEHILIDMREMTFFSLDQLNSVLWERLDELNGQPLTGKDCSRWDVFSQDEREHLLPLPSEPYQYLERKKVRAYQDFHVRFDQNYYSLPKSFVKQLVEVRASADNLVIYSEAGTPICTWKRSHARGGWFTNPDHLPQKYKEYLQWSKPSFQQWASKIGPYTRTVIDGQFDRVQFPVQAFRTCQGILSFSKRYTSIALEECCKQATLRGSCSYTYIKNTIANFIVPDQKPDALPPVPEPQRPVSGYKSNDLKYSLKQLLNRQEGDDGKTY
jgi:transposase